MIDLARRRAGHRVGVHVDGADGQAGQLDQPGAEVIGRVAGRAHDEPIVVAGRGRVDALARQRGLDRIEVDAQPERLHEPRAPSDDLEHVIGRVVAAEIARGQLVDGRAERQVVLGGGVAEHDVVAAVHELPDAIGHSLDGPQLQVPAGDRPADGPRVAAGERGRQVGHAGGRLGLAVHHEQLDAPLLRAIEPRPDALGRPSGRRPAS